jgi:hypothetical protein
MGDKNTRALVISGALALTAVAVDKYAPMSAAFGRGLWVVVIGVWVFLGLRSEWGEKHILSARWNKRLTIPAPIVDEVAGWEGVDVDGRFFAWKGPKLFSLPNWDAVTPPAGLIESVRAAGMTPGYGMRHKLGRHLREGLQVFETDKKTFRRPVVEGDEAILLVRPSGKEPR